MTDWEAVRQRLADAGYPGFEYDAGRTAVPGLSGEWVVGEIPRTEGLAHENQPLPSRLLDRLPWGAATSTDPERAPTALRSVADEFGLGVVIVSTTRDSARVALVAP